MNQSLYSMLRKDFLSFVSFAYKYWKKMKNIVFSRLVIIRIGECYGRIYDALLIFSGYLAAAFIIFVKSGKFYSQSCSLNFVET